MNREIENTPIHTAIEDGIESPVREPRTEANEPRFALEQEALRHLERNYTGVELALFLRSRFPDLASLIVNSLKDADLIALVKEAREA